MEHKSNTPESAKKPHKSADITIQSGLKSVQNNIANTVGNLENDSPETAEAKNIWDIYRHPGLQEEMRVLSDQEKELINTHTADIVRDIRSMPEKTRVFDWMTKTNGDIDQKITPNDYRSYPVFKEHKELGSQLTKQLSLYYLRQDKDLFGVRIDGAGDMTKVDDTNNVITHCHPQDPSLGILRFQNIVPPAHVLGDGDSKERRKAKLDAITIDPRKGFGGRNCRCKATVVLHRDIIEKLKSIHPKYVGFILRNAAMILNKDMQIVIDAPFSGNKLYGDKAQESYWIDTEDRSIKKREFNSNDAQTICEGDINSFYTWLNDAQWTSGKGFTRTTSVPVTKKTLWGFGKEEIDHYEKKEKYLRGSEVTEKDFFAPENDYKQPAFYI